LAKAQTDFFSNLKRSFFMKAIFKKVGQAALVLGVATLVACGGGSNAPVLTISGVAATGLAIEGGSVAVQCVSGTGTATTLANGTYSVSVTNGQGPCLVTVTKGALVLRSITSKVTSGTAIANVTQFSDAIVTALVTAKGAASPAALVTNAALVPSDANLTAASTAVIVKINEALVALNQPTLPLNTNLLGQSGFVAATGTTAGDALDKALDALVTNDRLAPTLTNSINSSVVAVVPKPPTGATGAN
jgi:hypothetical protein